MVSLLVLIEPKVLLFFLVCAVFVLFSCVSLSSLCTLSFKKLGKRKHSETAEAAG